MYQTEISRRQSNPNALILIPFTGVTKIFSEVDLKRIYSSAASDRLQIQPLISALDNLGYSKKAASLNTTFELDELKALEKFDLCIASKMRCGRSQNSNQFAQFHTCCALELKRKGAKLLTIYSDNIINSTSLDSELYKNLLFLSDHIVTPSRKLSSLAASELKKNASISVIEDPCLLNKKDFTRLKPDEAIRLLWFGNFDNLKYLMRILENLIQNSNSTNDYELSILTSEYGIAKIQKSLKKYILNNNWSLRLAIWNMNDQPRQLEEELSRAHIALLPSDPLDPNKNGASHNRLIDSIQTGCIAIASPIESYIELSKVCLLGDDFAALLNFAVENYQRLCNKYTKLRDQQLERFNPRRNITNWEKAIKKTSDTNN